ncbi:MAG: restriction endonuclease subunit S [Verrucomicrobiaceae bacterium]
MRPLGRCGQVLGGGTPSKNKPDYWDGEIPWVTAKEMWNSEVLDTELKITQQGLKASPAKLIPANSVLFVVRGSILFKRVPVAINRIACTINQDMKAIVPTEDILGDYLALMMRASNDELKSLVGTAGNSAGKLDTDMWSEVKIPIPAESEQRRLVARIESLTTRAQELAEHTQAIASDMQRAAASFYERLAAEAPQQPLEAVASPVRRPITTTPEGSYPELGLRSFGKGTFHKPALSGTEVGGKRIFRIHAGDLVFSNVFGWEGAIAVAQPEDDGRAGSHRYITYLADPERSTPEFLCFHFLTARGLEDIRAASPGSAGRNRTLGLERLKQIQVPVPPIEDQRRFSELVKRQREITKHASAITEDLRKFEAALLAKAFRGEL